MARSSRSRPRVVLTLASFFSRSLVLSAQGKITAQGKLLLHGQLYCSTELSRLPSKEFKELQVFLFEQAIIFSEIVGKRTQFIQPVFIYKAHIQVAPFSEPVTSSIHADPSLSPLLSVRL